MRLKAIGLISVLALGLCAAPLLTAAQETKKFFRVGILSTGSPRSAPHYAAFVQELQKLGYVEGQNLTVEFRNARGRPDRASALAAELAQLGVDVIVAAGAEMTLLAIREATATIPIVMVAVDYDPLARGYIASLSRPGGNTTGVVFQQVSLTSKRLELLKEAVPTAGRIAVFWDAISADQLRAAEAAAKTIGVRLLPRELREPPYDFASAIREITQAHPNALMVLQSPLMSKPDRAILPNLAIQHRLPAIFGHSRYATVGGLMSYGVNVADTFRRAAHYVDRILQGTLAGELPVEQPTKFELLVNLRTAKKMGLTIPSSILYRADRVIR